MKSDEHDANMARRHVANRVQELQLSELIMSMGVLDSPPEPSRPSYPHHQHNHTQRTYYTHHTEQQPATPCFEQEDEDIRAQMSYTRVMMPSTVKKRPALRDIDFSLLDDSYEVV